MGKFKLHKWNLGFEIYAKNRNSFQFLVKEIEEKILNKHNICYKENIYLIKLGEQVIKK